TIVTSAGGVHWRPRQAVKGFHFYQIAYGNGQFVASGGSSAGPGGILLTSSDGVNWLKVYISFSRKDVGGIAYGNGQFVAVGNLGTILTSTDGTNWVQQQPGTTIGLRGVAYGNGPFVA